MRQKIFILQQDTQTFIYVFYKVFKNILFYISKIFSKNIDHFGSSSVKRKLKVCKDIAVLENK